MPRACPAAGRLSPRRRLLLAVSSSPFRHLLDAAASSSALPPPPRRCPHRFTCIAFTCIAFTCIAFTCIAFTALPARLARPQRRVQATAAGTGRARSANARASGASMAQTAARPCSARRIAQVDRLSPCTEDSATTLRSSLVFGCVAQATGRAMPARVTAAPAGRAQTAVRSSRARASRHVVVMANVARCSCHKGWAVRF